MVLLFVVLTISFSFNGCHHSGKAGTKTITTTHSVAKADRGHDNTRTVAQVLGMDTAQLRDCTDDGSECKVNESCLFMQQYRRVFEIPGTKSSDLTSWAMTSLYVTRH